MTADEKGYNGWSNYETWVTALWIDNEEGSYTWSRELAREAAGVANYSPKTYLADNLKDELSDAMPDLGGTLWADLLGAAFGEVDWYEIAENYLSELQDA